MNGLNLYKQYLENIRCNISNYELDELKSSKFIDILIRSQEIQDLFYLDTIFNHAGLSLSFLGDRSFLNEPIQIKSKIAEMFIEGFDLDDDAADCIIDCFSNILVDEDSVIERLNILIDDLGVPSMNDIVDNEVVWRSEDETTNLDSLLEQERSSLEQMFNGLSKVSSIIDEEKNKHSTINNTNKIEKEYRDDENLDAILFEDLDEVLNTYIEENVGDTEKSLYENLDNDNIDLNDSDIDYDRSADNDLDKDYDDLSDDNLSDDDLLDDDFSENNSFEDLEKGYNEDSDDIDFNDYFNDCESTDKSSVESVEKNVRSYSVESEGSKFNHYRDGRQFEEGKFDIKDFETDEREEISIEDESVDYFLHGGIKDKLSTVEELKRLAHTSGRLKNSEDISVQEDTLAKFLIGASGVLLSAPSSISRIFRGMRKNSHKLKNMIVDDEDSESE